MVYAHRRGPRDSKKMKHKRRDPGNSVSSSRSNFARAMRGHTPKLRNFLALRNQPKVANPDSPNKLIITSPNAPTSELQQFPQSTSKSAPQDKRSSGRNRRNQRIMPFKTPL